MSAAARGAVPVHAEAGAVQFRYSSVFSVLGAGAGYDGADDTAAATTGAAPPPPPLPAAAAPALDEELDDFISIEPARAPAAAAAAQVSLPRERPPTIVPDAARARRNHAAHAPYASPPRRACSRPKTPPPPRWAGSWPIMSPSEYWMPPTQRPPLQHPRPPPPPLPALGRRSCGVCPGWRRSRASTRRCCACTKVGAARRPACLLPSALLFFFRCSCCRRFCPCGLHVDPGTFSKTLNLGEPFAATALPACPACRRSGGVLPLPGALPSRAGGAAGRDRPYRGGGDGDLARGAGAGVWLVRHR